MSTNLNLGRKNKATATVLLKRNVFFNGKLVLGFQLFSLVKNKDENYEVNNHHQSLISLF